jgi:hypothetical protein
MLDCRALAVPALQSTSDAYGSALPQGARVVPVLVVYTGTGARRVVRGEALAPCPPPFLAHLGLPGYGMPGATEGSVTVVLSCGGGAGLLQAVAAAYPPGSAPPTAQDMMALAPGSVSRAISYDVRSSPAQPLTSVVLGGLAVATAYDVYVVVADETGAMSQPAAIGCATVDLSPPLVWSLAATPGPTSLALEWLAQDATPTTLVAAAYAGGAQSEPGGGPSPSELITNVGAGVGAAARAVYGADARTAGTARKSLVIAGLSPLTEYTVFAAGVDSYGNVSSSCPSVTATTLAATGPPEVLAFEAVSSAEGSLSARWQVQPGATGTAWVTVLAAEAVPPPTSASVVEGTAAGALASASAPIGLGSAGIDFGPGYSPEGVYHVYMVSGGSDGSFSGVLYASVTVLDTTGPTLASVGVATVSEGEITAVFDCSDNSAPGAPVAVYAAAFAGAPAPPPAQGIIAGTAPGIVSTSVQTDARGPGRTVSVGGLSPCSQYTVYLAAVDKRGNVGSVAAVSVATADVTPPELTVNTVSVGESGAVFEFTCTDNSPVD